MVPGVDTIGRDGALEGNIVLSLIIPCYNEESRLPATLRTVLEFLATRAYDWELIIADDGSDDGTARIAQEAASPANVRYLPLPHRGKAAAVRAGVDAARGRFIVFTDADLSTPIEYLEDVVRLLSADLDLVIGTREGAGARRLGEPAYRHLMGRLFNYLVRVLVVRGVQDTQCGFKAFRADVAHDLFGCSLLYRDATTEIRGPLVTGFDVELLFLARKRGYRLCQLPVTWHHVDGSKVRPGIDSLLMVRDTIRVRLNDLRHRYDPAPGTEMMSHAGSSEP